MIWMDINDFFLSFTLLVTVVAVRVIPLYPWYFILPSAFEIGIDIIA